MNVLTNSKEFCIDREICKKCRYWFGKERLPITYELKYFCGAMGFQITKENVMEKCPYGFEQRVSKGW